MIIYARDGFADYLLSRTPEWIAASMVFTYGWVLATHPGLMQTHWLFSQMQFLSQPVWAWACVVVGLVRIVVLAINGCWRRSPHARMAAALVSCVLWFQIVLGLTDPNATTGLAVYPLILVMEFANIIRCARDARAVDDRYRSIKNGAT